ncbi:hypothetical protein [Lysinibacillus sp. BNK-21]|uniref:hypothetical protein n=1 Tax=Lysinibacillus sp. BNK-21 TaxID=3376156 RepID=UPI003B42C961
MNRLELYKELYFKELERKEQISARLQWIISFWLIVMGGILFSLNNIHKIASDMKIYFFVLIFVSLLAMLRSTLYIGFCLWGKTIDYLPSPKSIEREYENLVTHYAGYPEYQGEIEKVFEKRMMEIFNECSTLITRVNDTTITKLVKSTQSMLIAAILLLLSFSFMLPDFLKGEEPINKVEIINGSDLKSDEWIKLRIKSEE